jgi:tryptophanyl-tRNA synthetase
MVWFLALKQQLVWCYSNLHKSLLDKWLKMGKEQAVLLSGIQPSGVPTFAQYVGAMRQWLALQDEYRCFFFLADMHTITVRQDPTQFQSCVFDLLALYLACGLDAEKHAVFLQSQVPQHATLAWILGCYTMAGELGRMTQYKDKAKRHASNVNAGLLTYPVLMAADILLYDASVVPVGADQDQHLELARNIAGRFNHHHGDVLRMPELRKLKQGARIMALQNPEIKMSKSDANSNNVIFMLDEPKVIEKKIKRAVTDSEGLVAHDLKRPGISNLVELYAACSGQSVASIESDYAGKGYGVFKQDLAALVVSQLSPIQQEFKQIRGDQKWLEEVLHRGKLRAQEQANTVLGRVKEAIGFIG